MSVEMRARDDIPANILIGPGETDHASAA